MKKFLNVIGIIFSFFLTIAMFGLELVLIVNLILNTFITKDNLGEIIEELLTLNGQNNVTLLTMASENTYGNIKVDYASLEGKIEYYLIDYGFTATEAKEIINDEEFKNLVNSYIESVVLNKVKDIEIRYPSKEEIKRFVRKNYDKINKIKTIQGKYTKDNIDEIVDEGYEEIKEKLDEVTEGIKIPEIKEIEFLKEIVNISPFLLGGCLIGVIFLLMISRMSFYKWLIWTSIPTFINGLLFSALGLFGMNLIESLVRLDEYADILDPIAKKMSTIMTKYGIIMIIITIVMIVTYIIIKNNIGKEEKTKKKKA